MIFLLINNNKYLLPSSIGELVNIQPIPLPLMYELGFLGPTRRYDVVKICAKKIWSNQTSMGSLRIDKHQINTFDKLHVVCNIY